MYRLEISRRELESLAWVADRYASAAVLYDALCAVNDEDEPTLWEVSESDALAYIDVLENDEDGSPLVPPCIGGHLAETLLAFRESIV